MPYVADHALEELFDRTPAVRMIDRLTDDVGHDLTDEVTRRTPVADVPPGMTPTEFEGLRGRVPGSLKASWETGFVERMQSETPGGEKRGVESFTEDPIAPHVEWPTRPHVIRPRLDRAAATVLESGRPLRTDEGARLRFVNAFGRVVYASEVHHPGTQGSHMMRDALAMIEGSWTIRRGEAAVKRWAREQAELVR